MSQIQRALSYYWSLRDQGKSQAEAANHTRLRFGVVVDPDEPLASTSEVIEFAPGDRVIDCENDEATFVGKTWDGTVVLQYDDPELGFVALDEAKSEEDVELIDSLRPIGTRTGRFGSDFAKTIRGTSSTPGLLTTKPSGALKQGDRVRFNSGFAKGYTGTIVKPNGVGWSVTVDSYGANQYYYLSHEIERA